MLISENMAIKHTGGASFYVSLLPEDFQDKCKLQEAHENTQVILRQTMRLKYKFLAKN